MASKRELILEYLRETALPLIRVADGFNFTPKLIERGWRHPAGLGNDFPAIFIAGTNEKRKNDTMGTARNFTATMTVTVVGYVKNSKPNPKADGTGVQKDLSNLIYDIERALYRDISQGGLANYTDIVGVETDDGDLFPIAGCALTVEIGYYEEGNP